MREYHFNDINGDPIQNKRQKEGRGCYVSTTLGFVLLLLAVLISVGVGIVVHFAGPKETICKCDTVSPTLSPSALQSMCVEKAKEGDVKICNACPKPSSPSTNTIPSTSTIITSKDTTTTVPTTTPKPSPTPTSPINYRLPTSLKPEHYNIMLKPDIYTGNPRNFSIEGTVVISISVIEDTSNITVNLHELNVIRSSIKILPEDGGFVAPGVSDVEYDNVREFYIIYLTSSLRMNTSFLLEMQFHGKMRNDNVGMYLSSYKADNNETVYLAATQFAGPHARKAFPCFDEPAMKATYNITLLRKNNTDRPYKSLTNTDIMYTEPRRDGYVADRFNTTPPMSTYLLAFIVCDYNYLQNTTKDGIVYRTWARPNAYRFGEFAQEFGIQVFEWYLRHLTPGYPIPKLDNLAIPDFKFGAMENWGLITYRERLLFEPGVSTKADEKWIIEITAHEIAHQWFGNIVSPLWFNWVWLNEAFASFWDFHSVDKLYPSYRRTEQTIVEAVYAVFVTDSLRSSHAMTYEVRTPLDVDSSYDRIPYFKGAHIVRMMWFVMGEDRFMQGLNIYLNKYQYSVATDYDLFNSLNEVTINETTFINMTDVMDTWVKQMNYPVVHVSRIADGVIRVTQDRFLSRTKGADSDTALYGFMWDIPITFTTSQEKNFTKQYQYKDIDWLRRTHREGNISSSIIPGPTDTNGWVVVNIQQYGYYRVNYDISNWMALIKQLKDNLTVIHPLNRAQIINDAWSLAEANKLNISIALGIFKYLRKETDYLPWRAFEPILNSCDAMLEHSDLYGAFEMFMADMVAWPFSMLGMRNNADDPPLQVFVRSIIVKYACEYGIKVCEQNTTTEFGQWMMSPAKNLIDPNLKTTVYCSAVRYGGWREWSFAHGQYKNTPILSDKPRLRDALACSREPWLLSKLLIMSLNHKDIARGDTSSVITSVAKNPVGRDLAWNFIKDNMQTLSDILGSGTLSKLIADVTSAYYSDYQYQEVARVSNSTTVTGINSALKKALETITENKQWMEKNYGLFREALQAYII